jgi:hypothetical protein
MQTSEVSYVETIERSLLLDSEDQLLVVALPELPCLYRSQNIQTTSPKPSYHSDFASVLVDIRP